jgi:hypothetical protein
VNRGVIAIVDRGVRENIDLQIKIVDSPDMTRVIFTEYLRNMVKCLSKPIDSIPRVEIDHHFSLAIIAHDIATTTFRKNLPEMGYCSLSTTHIPPISFRNLIFSCLSD